MYFDTIYASGLPSRAIMVYQYLSDRAGKDKQCFPSIRRIAADLSISESTVKRALKDLDGAGYICWMNRNRRCGKREFGKTSNLYRVLRQHRTILVRRLRSQNFRQIVQKFEGILCVFPRIFGRYDGIFSKQDACRELCGVALK